MRLLALSASFIVLACQSPATPPAPPAPPSSAAAPAAPARTPVKVTGTEARQLISSGALLVDVRTPEEYEQLHLDGARNVPLASLVDSVGSLPKGQPIIVYCAVGARSARAADLLASAGYDVRNLGAMENWKK